MSKQSDVRVAVHVNYIKFARNLQLLCNLVHSNIIRVGGSYSPNEIFAMRAVGRLSEEPCHELMPIDLKTA